MSVEMDRERPWDRFLTERDRQHLAVVGDLAPVGFGRQPALLLIDNYRAALGYQRLPLLEAIAEFPSSTGLEGWEAVDEIQVVLAECRAKGIHVIHVTALDPQSSGVGGWDDVLHHRRPKEAADSYEIVDEVAPIDGEIVLRKSAPSAFWGTPLAAVVNQLGIDTLLVAGESTSGCVRATVQDAASYRLRTVVIEECVYDRHQAAHAMSLFDMHRKFADVMSSSDVLSWLRDLPQ